MLLRLLWKKNKLLRPMRTLQVIVIHTMLNENYAVQLCQRSEIEILYLDVMMYLSHKLDKKTFSQKFSFIWKEWTNRKDLFDLTSKGSFAFKFFLWVLR